MKHRTEKKSLEKIKLELAALGAGTYQLGLGETRELSKVLFSDEDVKAFVTGFYDGGYAMLVATNLRLLFVDAMPFGRVKVEDIPYSSIGSVTVQLGIMFGSVSVQTRPRTYKFWWLKKDQAYDFNDYVERQMLKHHKENVRVD